MRFCGRASVSVGFIESGKYRETVELQDKERTIYGGLGCTAGGRSCQYRVAPGSDRKHKIAYWIEVAIRSGDGPELDGTKNKIRYLTFANARTWNTR